MRAAPTAKNTAIAGDTRHTLSSNTARKRGRSATGPAGPELAIPLGALARDAVARWCTALPATHYLVAVRDHADGRCVHAHLTAAELLQSLGCPRRAGHARVVADGRGEPGSRQQRPVAGGARPVLLAPPPPSEEPGDSAEISRCAGLRRPVPAVPPPDPAAVAAGLRGAFAWMEDAVAAVVRELALAGLGTTGVCRLPPLLLVTPPGAGKTAFAAAIAEACGLPLHRLAAPDTSSATHLAGLGRGWRSARPCAPLRAVLESGMRNPLRVVDDVDRAPADERNGTVPAVLLGLLELESARRYEDPLLAVPADLSAVNWVLAGRLAGLEARREELRAALAEPPPAPARLQPDLGEVYRARVAALREALAGEGAPEALEAARALVAGWGWSSRLRTATAGRLGPSWSGRSGRCSSSAAPSCRAAP